MAGTAETVVLSGMAMTTAGGVARHLDPAPVPARQGVVTELATRAEPEPAGPSRLADRPSAMATDALEALLAGVLDDCPPDRRGLVLGSGSVGIDQSMTLTTDSLTRPRPYNVSPALVPACVMNYASALCAIRFDLRGPNATVTAGRATGLAALSYADRLVRTGRADLVVCGAFEDLNERRAAFQRIRAGGGPGTALGEGCCVFLVETAGRARLRGRPVLAELLALESGVGDDPAVLSGVVGRALSRAGVSGEEVTLAAGFGGEDLGALLPNAAWLYPADVIGDTLGAGAAFQLGAVVLEGGTSPGTPAAVVAHDPDGQAACAILRPSAR